MVMEKYIIKIIYFKNTMSINFATCSFCSTLGFLRFIMLKHIVLLIPLYSILLYNYVEIYVEISPINTRFKLFKFLDVFSASMESDAMLSGSRHTDTK